MVEKHEYPNYGWGSVVFMTDKFGGVYANFHFDFATGKVVNWFGQKDEAEMPDFKTLEKTVVLAKAKLEKSRDLGKIYKMINDEY